MKNSTPEDNPPPIPIRSMQNIITTEELVNKQNDHTTCRLSKRTKRIADLKDSRRQLTIADDVCRREKNPNKKTKLNHCYRNNKT